MSDQAAALPFNSRQDLYDLLDRVLHYVSSDIAVAGNLGECVPRFGLLGAIVRKTPVHLYDHPQMLEMCGTAFTDGLSIFIAAPYFEELVQEQRAGFDSAVAIFLHEAGHILRNHYRRLHGFPPNIRNVAADIRIDLDTMFAFPFLKFGPKAYWLCGLDRADTEAKYGKSAEETIAAKLMADPAMQPRQGSIEQLMESIKQDLDAIGEDGKAPKDVKAGAGKLSDGMDAGDDQQTRDGASELQAALCQSATGEGGRSPDSWSPPSSPGDGGPFDGLPLGVKLDALLQALESKNQLAGASIGEGVNHISSPEQLAEALKEMGLGDRAAKLQIDTQEQRDEQKAAQAMKLIDAVRNAASLKQKHGASYPGGHIVDSAVELIDGFSKPKLSWQARVRELMEGDGMNVERSMAIPSSLYYVDPSVMGLNMQAYLPAFVPAKPRVKIVGIVDSSASVSRDLAARLLSEFLGFADNASDFSPELMIVSADTVVRGEPEFITSGNVDSFLDNGFKMHGRGGTSFIEPINAAVAMAKQKALDDGDWREQSVVVIYATDFECSPPAPDDLPEGLGGLAFIGPAGVEHDNFAANLHESMMAIAIEQDVTVDLEHLEALAQERDDKRKGLRP